jgi:hypothetical protein
MFAIYSLGVKLYVLRTDALIMLMIGLASMSHCVFSRPYRIKPIADAIEGAGVGWQSEWENPTGWRFNGAGFFHFTDKIGSFCGVRAHDFDQGRFGGPTH